MPEAQRTRREKLRAIQAFEDMQEVAAAQVQDAPDAASEEKKDRRGDLYEENLFSP